MKHCINSLSFFTLGVIVFISETISLIMNIVLLIKTSWNFLKKTIKLLNIICISIILLTTFINIIFFCKLKKIKNEVVRKFTSKIAAIVFLIIFYILIIIFSIYNSIYLSIRLHIADFPEYGGRERDQNYIDSHPNEFGDVSENEFIMVAVCPSIIGVLNLLCVIISFLIRNKIILIYNKTKEKYSNYLDEQRHKNKSHKHKHERKRKRRNSTNNYIIKTSNELMDSYNNNTHNFNSNNNSFQIDKIIKLKDNNNDSFLTDKNVKPNDRRNSSAFIDKKIIRKDNKRRTLNDKKIKLEDYNNDSALINKKIKSKYKRNSSVFIDRKIKLKENNNEINTI